jgi:hypothetical protein
VQQQRINDDPFFVQLEAKVKAILSLVGGRVSLAIYKY